MNSFAALTLDSDDEEAPKVNNKKTTTAAPAAKAAKAPMVQRNIPGMAKKFTATTTAAPAYAAEDPAANKVNDRGGNKREMYNGHSNVKGATPNDSKAHKDRHDYARTGKSAGGKDGARGGRGPGGWGSPEEEARRAAKGESEDAVEGGDETTEEAVVEEAAPTVFGFEEAMARREAARAASTVFGSVKERVVSAPELKEIAAKEEVPAHLLGKATGKSKKESGHQRSNLKTSIGSSFRVETPSNDAPREARPEGAGGRGGRGGRGDRDGGRGGRGGRGAAPAAGASAAPSKLRDDDFPAL